MFNKKRTLNIFICTFSFDLIRRTCGFRDIFLSQLLYLFNTMNYSMAIITFLTFIYRIPYNITRFSKIAKFKVPNLSGHVKMRVQMIKIEKKKEYLNWWKIYFCNLKLKMNILTIIFSWQQMQINCEVLQQKLCVTHL